VRKQLSYWLLQQRAKYLILSCFHPAKHNLEDTLSLKIFDNIKVYSYLYVSKFFGKKISKNQNIFLERYFLRKYRLVFEENAKFSPPHRRDEALLHLYGGMAVFYFFKIYICFSLIFVPQSSNRKM
jgi:hypothetical protein